MGRKLFCEISPLTYSISVWKCRMVRRVKDFFSGDVLARTRSEEILPETIYRHNSLIRRRLGNVNMELQDNKAVNLALAAPKVSHVLIRPNEVFSFWNLVGHPTEKKGYKNGLVISTGQVGEGIGGGMCQFTNLIHWMVLHTPMEIVERHHHDSFDLFPDFNRQVPFGTGTSIFYNYLDYRFKNTTSNTYQLIVYTTDEYLCGEIRATAMQENSYHIYVKDERFVKEDRDVYRTGSVYRRIIDKRTGETIQDEPIQSYHAKVMYDFTGVISNESSEFTI